MTDDKGAVLCARVCHVPDQPLPNAVKHECSICGEPVWVASETLTVIDELSGEVFVNLYWCCCCMGLHPETKGLLP